MKFERGNGTLSNECYATYIIMYRCTRKLKLNFSWQRLCWFYKKKKKQWGLRIFFVKSTPFDPFYYILPVCCVVILSAVLFEICFWSSLFIAKHSQSMQYAQMQSAFCCFSAAFDVTSIDIAADSTLSLVDPLLYSTTCTCKIARHTKNIYRRHLFTIWMAFVWCTNAHASICSEVTVGSSSPVMLSTMCAHKI